MDRETVFGLRPKWAAALIPVAVTAAYSNHFRNHFQFDDSHTIVQNVWIRSLANIPRFFTDGSTFSALPSNRTWRPLVSTSLAIDYWLGGGLNPLWFHISTFVWFLAQLGLMFLLFRKILSFASEGPAADWAAVFATAFYGLHPANAETVNYIIQRGDLYATLGVVASLVIYVAAPARRRHNLFLIPFAVALLAKPPAIIFPVILGAYVVLFEHRRGLWKVALAAILGGSLMMLEARMTPPTFAHSTVPALNYVLTQPFVALHYFLSFFVPLTLSADTDLVAFLNPFTTEALTGYIFIALLLWAIFVTARRRITSPICFGLVWFFVALLPTSLYPLSEVENDHRMFLPFVGLTLAVTWSAALLLKTRPRWIACAAVAVLCLYGQGVWQRNRVWSTEESLWRDVATKSPHNGRGLMNYGLVLMARGQALEARDYFERAAQFTPNYYVLEINRAIVSGVLGQDAEAETHFQRARQLAPDDAQPDYFYGRWLHQKRRNPEAAGLLRVAVAKNPVYEEPQTELEKVQAENLGYSLQQGRSTTRR